MHNDVDISEGQQTVLSWSVTAASARFESRRFLSVLHCTVSLNQSSGGERRCVCGGGGGGGRGEGWRGEGGGLGMRLQSTRSNGAASTGEIKVE